MDPEDIFARAFRTGFFHPEYEDARLGRTTGGFALHPALESVLGRTGEFVVACAYICHAGGAV